MEMLIEEKKLESFTKSRSNNDNDINKDSNYMFFMSLLPQMRDLLPLRNMHMRLKIQSVFLQHQNAPQGSCCLKGDWSRKKSMRKPKKQGTRKGWPWIGKY